MAILGNIATPFINGHRYDYGSIEIRIDGVPILGRDVVSISYKHGLKPEKVRGTGAEAIGRTRGVYDAEGSMEITKEAYSILVAALAANPQLGYMENAMIIDVAYQEAPTLPLQRDVLLGCRITEDEDSHKAGGEGLTVRCQLDIQKILRNGINPLGIANTLINV